MLNAIALDDEIPALEIIEDFAGRTDKLALNACFTKTSEALAYLNSQPVDLLFLDINMPAMSGIDLAKRIPPTVMVIFTTSYSEYAVEGFNLDAVDYLLKPFTFNRFEQALDKAIRLRETVQNTQDESLFLKANYGVVKLSPAEILFVEGLDNYLKISLENKKSLIVRMTMKELLALLPSQQFLQVHRSYIIALSRIDTIRNKTIFIGDKEIPIGGKFEKALYEQFEIKN
ncbi:MAG: LytTR family DNA-binding domain-containing protein [Saprospiraceae bacterium]|nr:response regulator transcription factor [Saprospiraceae bacterium]MCB9343548.1 response regulator transcription factor [Lewinellaceae bacterium]